MLNQSARLSTIARTRAQGGANPLPAGPSEPHRDALGRTSRGRSGRSTDAPAPRIRTQGPVIFALWFFCSAMILLAWADGAEAFAPAANQGLQKYERIAEDYWGQTPNCEQVEYAWFNRDPMGKPNVVARAAQGGCYIELYRLSWLKLEGDVFDRYLAFEDSCDTIVHEWGHLLGHDHDPLGVNDMTPAVLRSIAEACEAAADRRYPTVVRLYEDQLEIVDGPKRNRCRRPCAAFKKVQKRAYGVDV